MRVYGTMSLSVKPMEIVPPIYDKSFDPKLGFPVNVQLLIFSLSSGLSLKSALGPDFTVKSPKVHANTLVIL